MIVLENKLIIWAAALLAGYVIYRLVSSLGSKSSDYEQELEKVLTSEECKVKGRHE